MRIVQLPGPKARYARLTMMDKLPERGLAPLRVHQEGPFTVSAEAGADGAYAGASVRCSGLRIRTDSDALPFRNGKVFDGLFPHLSSVVGDQATTLRTRWKAAVLGLDLTRTPRLSSTRLSQRLESMDLGYDL